MLFTWFREDLTIRIVTPPTATGRASGAPGAGGRTGPGRWEVHARIERFVEPALLLVLRDGETHGYELAEALAELAPDDAVDLGNLYRLLRSLEVEGLVVSRWRDDLPGRTKRTYALTAEGRALLDEWAAVPAPGRRHRRHIPGALTSDDQRRTTNDNEGRSGRMSHHRRNRSGRGTSLHEHHHHHHDRLRHTLQRRLRRDGDDVAALEELQRDLEQAVADVAARIAQAAGAVDPVVTDGSPDA